MIASVLMAGVLAASLPSWEFDNPASLRQWVPNGHVANVKVTDGVLTADAIDWDPFFSCDGLEIPATPWQYVIIRLKASEPGTGELYWSGETTGQYGGLSPGKRTPFQVKEKDVWQEIVLFPYWQGEKTIRKLRLDVYQGVSFSVDYIRLGTWCDADTPASAMTSWTFDDGGQSWRPLPTADQFVSPALQVDVDQLPWLGVRLTSPHDGVGTILWGSRDRNGPFTREFLIDGDSQSCYYNVNMQEGSDWKGEIAVLGVELPAGARLEAVQLGTAPSGPARLKPISFGFAEGVNRAGKNVDLCLHLQNVGGAPSDPLLVDLALPAGVLVDDRSRQVALPTIASGGRASVRWTVQASAQGTYAVTASAGQQPLAHATVRVDPQVSVQGASYVPEPRPVETEVEICAYYFPGFDSDKRWVPVRETAPIRKPLLGWYDEGSPECVDWQIKWARENGISVFFVDWYWVAGKQQLTHWFEAYRQAHYRDQLKVAIMWANHNPPNTHSTEDWDRVTREWLERYFNLPAYYRIDGKPVVMIWDPNRLREDLAQAALRENPGQQVNSTELVKKALEHSRTLARAAGYEGVTFVAIQHAVSASRCEVLEAEGYNSVTTYHEWGRAASMGPSALRSRFDDVVATAPETWREWKAAAAPMDYYPVIDTGWDSRPWHGAKARVIDGRTPDNFKVLLSEARAFAKRENCRRLVLGPLNEWGEGSYIEPCAEFGFAMMECVREVFGLGPVTSWPVNIGPSDVGLGPYEYVEK